MFITPTTIPMLGQEAKDIIAAVDFTSGARVTGERDGQPFTVKLRSADSKYDVVIRNYQEEINVIVDDGSAIYDFMFNRHIFKFLKLPESISASPYYWAANLEISTRTGQKAVHVNFTGLHHRIESIITRLKSRSDDATRNSFEDKIDFLTGLLSLHSVEELLVTVHTSEYPDIFELFRGQSLFVANAQFTLICAIARKAMLHAATIAGWD